MKYRVVVSYGNGYLCSCCRETFLRRKEFNYLEEALDYANEIQALSMSESYLENKDDSDVRVIEIIAFEKIEFSPDKEKVNALIQKYKDAKEKRDREELILENKLTEEREKKQLRDLLEKYPKECKCPEEG